MTCSERGKMVTKCKEMVKIDILGGDRTELRQYMRLGVYWIGRDYAFHRLDHKRATDGVGIRASELSSPLHPKERSLQDHIKPPTRQICARCGKYSQKWRKK
jgi:hypothetical protein